MAMIRFVLGKLILLFDWLFTPKRIQRDSAQQAGIDEQTALLTLYQYEACPFCVKVRRAMKRYGLHIEVRDVKRDSTAKNELLAGGGHTPGWGCHYAQAGAAWSLARHPG